MFSVEGFEGVSGVGRSNREGRALFDSESATSGLPRAGLGTVGADGFIGGFVDG